jgi:ribose-phosphate pyrophosphokinase
MITVNNVEIKPTIFPDKTSQVWKLPMMLFKSAIYDFEWVFESECEFMHLAQCMDLLKSHNPDAIYNLHFPYLPYARQDKHINNESTFAFRTFYGLIETLDFQRITCMDPHSDVATNCGIIARFPDVESVFHNGEYHRVAYPDDGAYNKYDQIYDLPYIKGKKVRDQSTGYITSYQIEHGEPNIDLKDKKILIVDDICDGGATFILLAKELFASGANKVDMFVTHGIFSKGTQVLKSAGIGKITTQYGEIE